MAIKDLSGRNAAKARRDAQLNGTATLPAKASSSTAPRVRPKRSVSADSQPSVTVTAKPAISNAPRAKVKTASAGREASRARRHAMSSRGKSGVASSDRQRVVDVARTARNSAQAQDCGCGCKGKGDCGDASVAINTASAVSTAKASATPRRSRHDVKVVTPSSAGRINSKMRRDAMAAHGKTGVDSFRKGVSSAQMVRKQNPDITGRELARTVRTQRSANGGSQSAVRSTGRRRPERPGKDVSGTVVSHSEKTTGDETGLCRSVTGTDYFSSEVFTEFCQDEAPNVPRKVEASENLSGGMITASGKVGLSEKVTGNDRGSGNAVTGIEYVGREQYDNFCSSKPEPGSAKVSFSQTTRGQIVSGSKPARSERVSGNEAGSCEVVTGTPYTGTEHYQKYCDTGAVKQVELRTVPPAAANAGRDITGVQPGITSLTGAGKGVCSEVSGTAYLGAEQQVAACGVSPAAVNEPDFPQPLSDAPWGAFSVVAPAQASQPVQESRPTAKPETVTGMRYEQGRVSGTFSLGEGKVTGTEQFRFGSQKSRNETVAASAKVAPVADVVSKVTGEGLDAGLKITGNDWNRGDQVTGTEGRSAAKRNPTRRGPVSAMPSSEPKRNEDVDRNDINVTGGSGSTESGALVTLSGGARG